MTLKKNKVLLGLSGGVDSTAAVLVLREKGFDVTGYYFDVLGDNQEGREHAQRVADQLEIPLIIEDVSKTFRDIVIANFCESYASGRTPNPCVMCNPNVKFKMLINKANEIGAYYIATGHYAQIIEENGIFYIAQGKNQRKDQSYMLYRLGQDVLSRLIFPLGQQVDKEDVRNIARNKGMINAETKDSQEICFISDDENHLDYIREHGYNDKQGNFVDKEGRVLGPHQGIGKYTIGQRKGLGIALGKPAFVIAIDSITGNVVLGDNEDLFTTNVYATDVVFASKDILTQLPLSVEAKIRYASKPTAATISMEEDGTIKAVFETPQRAATPGQSMVFYEKGKVIGGGFIVQHN